MAPLPTLVQDAIQRLWDVLHATWAGLPPGVAWLGTGLLLAGVVIGVLAGRRARSRPPEAATAPPEPAAPDAALRAHLAMQDGELAALRDAERRRDDDTEAAVQALCAALSPSLSALSEAAELGRASATDSAARADAVHACMAGAAEDAARTATTLAAVTRHVGSLARSVEAIAVTLAAVAEALGPEHDAGEEGGAQPATSLVGLAADSGSALAGLVATLEATQAAADAVAARVAEVRDEAENGSAAAQGMARATEMVGRNAVGIGLEITAFLDGLARAGNRRRFDRYPTDLAATVVVDGREHGAHIIDISRGGCAWDTALEIAAGSAVQLHLPGVDRPLDAVVARRLGTITGVKFADPDPLAGIVEDLIVPRQEVA